MQYGGCSIRGLGRIPKNAELSVQFALLRVILGTASVAVGGHVFKQEIDYSSIPAMRQNKTASAALTDFLIRYEVGGTLRRFIDVTIPDNRKFYREIVSELLNYHSHTSRSRHTSAFVFLYRILERISYSIPLLYVSTQNDYYGTFSTLKKSFESADGDLGFFKKFLSFGSLVDQEELQVLHSIVFPDFSGRGDRYFNLTKSRFSGCFSGEDSVNRKFEIKFIKIPELLIEIRNRFFHARTGDGRNNISALEVDDTDEYFGVLNTLFVGFLCVVILNALAVKYRA